MQKEKLSLEQEASNLIYSGFNVLYIYKPYVQRYIKQAMNYLCDTRPDLVCRFDFGRGKGKYRTAQGVDISDVMSYAQTDSTILKLAVRLRARRYKGGESKCE